MIKVQRKGGLKVTGQTVKITFPLEGAVCALGGVLRKKGGQRERYLCTVHQMDSLKRHRLV